MNPFRTIKELMQPVHSTVSEKKLRTKQLSVWEGSLWAVMWGLGESYIIPYALFLGAGNATMAFLGTGPVLITAAAQLIGASLLDRVGRRKPFILLGTGVQAASLIPLFLLPLLLTVGGTTAFLCCVTVYFLFFGIAVPPWMSLMGDVVEPSERGSYFSNRTRITMYSMIGAFLVAGIITNGWTHAGRTATGFGFLFGIAALARFTCIPFVMRHYEAPLEKRSQESTMSFKAFFFDQRHANYARFTFAVALLNGTTNIAGPFFAVYMLRDLQWPYFLFALNMTTFLVSQTLFVRWWGSIGDRHGNRSVLLATGSLLPILPLLWIFSTNYFVLLFAQVVSGATWSGFNLAASNFIYDSVPQAERARATSYYSLLNGAFSVVGGMLVGAWIADHAPTEFQLGLVHISLRSSLPVVFVVSGIARAIVGAFTLSQFSEVREVEKISTGQILWRFGMGQPLFGQAATLVPLLRGFIPAKRDEPRDSSNPL